jgi:hypothetical protein
VCGLRQIHVVTPGAAASWGKIYKNRKYEEYRFFFGNSPSDPTGK